MKETVVNDETFAIALELGFEAVEETPVVKKTGRKVAKMAEMDVPPKPVVPTQSLLQMWLRLNYDVHIGIRYTKYWTYEIVFMAKGYAVTGYAVNSSYEECLEKGLLLTLRLIRIKN